MLFQLSITFFLQLALIKSYKNPVQGFKDSPDPGVIFNGQSYYAVTTGEIDGHAFPLWKSDNLFSWTQVGWGLYQKPIWAFRDFWAPQIHYIGKNYKLIFTARDKDGMLCIGVAQSEKIQGPYIDIGHPLLKNNSQGVIDATVHKDGNKQQYLIYKIDGNAHGKSTYICAIKLANDGLSVQGQHTILIKDTLPYQNGIVEAPWIVENQKLFYMFYSSCGYADKCYSISVARSKNLLGPYVKFNRTILHTVQSQNQHSWEGPGHCSIVQTVRGNYGIVYHAWPHGAIGTKRLMLVDQLKWIQGWPSINNGSPSQTEMPNF